MHAAFTSTLATGSSTSVTAATHNSGITSQAKTIPLTRHHAPLQQINCSTTEDGSMDHISFGNRRTQISQVSCLRMTSKREQTPLSLQYPLNPRANPHTSSKWAILTAFFEDTKQSRGSPGLEEELKTFDAEPIKRTLPKPTLQKLLASHQLNRRRNFSLFQSNN